jgi:hypothetical protein
VFSEGCRGKGARPEDNQDAECWFGDRAWEFYKGKLGLSVSIDSGNILQHRNYLQTSTF